MLGRLKDKIGDKIDSVRDGGKRDGAPSGSGGGGAELDALRREIRQLRDKVRPLRVVPRQRCPPAV